MEEIKEGEIVYATFKVKDNDNKEHELRKVVFSREWKSEYPILRKEIYTRFLKQNGIKKDCTILDVKILARTGFKNRSKGYTIEHTKQWLDWSSNKRTGNDRRWDGVDRRESDRRDDSKQLELFESNDVD